MTDPADLAADATPASVQSASAALTAPVAPPAAQSHSERLTQLGIVLPTVPQAAGSYVPAVRTGNLVFTAGQLPFVDGTLPMTGKVGAEVSADDARRLARQAALNVLAAVDAAVGIDSVVRVVKVVGFVASTAGFNGQPGVINGASDLFAEVLGDAGRHARSAVGVSELPLNSPVEVEAIVEVR